MSEVCTLYIVRHGKSEGNEKRIWQGRRDYPLAEPGRQQAEAAAEYLRMVPFAACYTSPLARAYVTAGIILRGRDVPLYRDERLAELDAGYWSGHTIEWIMERYPDTLRCWRETPDACAFPGGETVRNAYLRAGEALDAYARSHPGQKVLVTTHAGIMRCLKARMERGCIEGMREPFHFPNCCLSVFIYDGGAWRVDRIGDASFLQAE